MGFPLVCETKFKDPLANMGCNQSTQQDVSKSRQRQAPPQNARRPQQAPSQTAPGASPSSTKPIGLGMNVEPQMDIRLGTSVSDTREAENEAYFKNLIEKTASNFIDVSSQQALPLEADDAEERSRNYAKRVADATLSSRPSTIFSLPKPSANNQTLTSLLALTPHVKDDRDLAEKDINQLAE